MDVPTMITELNGYGFEDIDSTEMTAKIQATIWDIEGRHPWPFLKTSVDLTFDGTSGVATNLPSDWRASLRMKNLKGGRIRFIRDDDFEDVVGTDYTKTDNPVWYYFGDSNQPTLWPIPPSGTTVRWKYIKWSAAITGTSAETAILIPKQFHYEAIINGTLSRLYAMDDDAEMSGYYGQLAENAIEKMNDLLFQPQFDQPDGVKSTDPDDWDFYFLL